jgi:hypothetical protein
MELEKKDRIESNYVCEYIVVFYSEYMYGSPIFILVVIVYACSAITG